MYNVDLVKLLGVGVGVGGGDRGNQLVQCLIKQMILWWLQGFESLTLRILELARDTLF
jgi:hypothetical protein